MITVLYWPGLYKDVKTFISNCIVCRTQKTPAEKHGKLPKRTLTVTQPWQEVAVDLMGPFKKQSVLTMIDTCTRWIEIIPIMDRTSASVAAAFENEWLNRYPRPTTCIHDQGSEFQGKEFQATLSSYGIRQQTSTTANPQSNAVVERVHRTIESMVNSQISSVDEWTDITQAVAFALRTTHHTALGTSPAQLVFQRDMIHDIAQETNWRRQHERRMEQIRRENIRENQNRKEHEFQPDDMVYIRFTSHKKPKIGTATEGPYRIVAVRENGTVVLDRGLYTEIINIRNLQPQPLNKGENELLPPLLARKCSTKAKIRYKPPRNKKKAQGSYFERMKTRRSSQSARQS